MRPDGRTLVRFSAQQKCRSVMRRRDVPEVPGRGMDDTRKDRSSAQPSGSPAADVSHDIFLSYSRADRVRVREVFEALGSQGWNVFMDEDIPNAARWEDLLLVQLEQVSCVLVLWSQSATDREWVVKEAEAGLKRGVLVHATLDGRKPPDALAALQTNDLSAWSTDDDPEFLSLLRAVAEKIGPRQAVGTLSRPARHERITENHIALTSTSWRRKGKEGLGRFPHQIHLRLVGSRAALKRVQNVVYYFDAAYAQNRPDQVDPVLKAYVRVSTDWRSAFTVYELANGYSVVRAVVKVKNQPKVVELSRLVDILEASPELKTLYPTWSEEDM